MLRAMEDEPIYQARYRFEQERQRLTTTLRQIADCIDALDVNELPEPMVRLCGPAEELVRVARLMLKRPFGE